MAIDSVRALTFDVFGTVVDWRGGVMREAAAMGQKLGVEADWGAFADAWRSLYGPSMARVRRGQRPWVKLDQLHRESLLQVAPQFGLGGLSQPDVEELVLAWHRLDPWPDVVEGLTRLKRRYVIAPLSNGNLALQVDLARRSGLPWDAILGSDVVRHYKTEPEAYLDSAELLNLRPEQVMMTAAHPSDLDAAARTGLRTAYVPRPQEVPGRPLPEVAPGSFAVIARDFIDLATQLGC